MEGKTDTAKSIKTLIEALQRKAYDARKSLLENDQTVSAGNIKTLLNGQKIN